MVNLIVTLVFGFVCLLSLTAVVVTLRQFGGSIYALRDEVMQGSPRQTVYYAVSDLRRSAQVVKLTIKPKTSRQSLSAAA